MESNEEIEWCSVYPIIYKVEIESQCFDEILTLFADEILQQAPCSKIEPVIVSYVTRVVEPIGWKAVWRSTQESLDLDVECDFVVEVLDVSLLKLEADVIVKSALIPGSANINTTSIENRFKQSKFCTVPLIELYPISEEDEEEMFGKTAVAIEHVRLFYTHLYRPWDSDEDICYTEKVLQPRLQLYFDIKKKHIPEVMISKISSILKEGWTIMNNLKSLYSHMNVSDSEAELSEEDVMDTLELRKRLEELQRNMDLLENPVIRTIMMRKYTPRKSPVKQPHEEGPLTYLVAARFTYEMLMSLKLEPSTLLKFDRCPEHALKSTMDGDTVYIFPGHYRCDTLGWLDCDVTVKGFGPVGSVKIEATGSSEVFVNCDSHSVKLENLTLISTEGVMSTLVAHHGNVVMKDCLISADGSDVGITLLGGSKLDIEDSEICNAKEDGIQMRPASTLIMKSSKVVSCGRHGLQLDRDEDGILAQATEVCIMDSFIVSNDGHGIYVNCAPSYAPEAGDSNGFNLNMFSWIKHNIENTVMSHNKHSSIGSAPAFKLTNGAAPSL